MHSLFISLLGKRKKNVAEYVGSSTDSLVPSARWQEGRKSMRGMREVIHNAGNRWRSPIMLDSFADTVTVEGSDDGWQRDFSDIVSCNKISQQGFPTADGEIADWDALYIITRKRYGVCSEEVDGCFFSLYRKWRCCWTSMEVQERFCDVQWWP